MINKNNWLWTYCVKILLIIIIFLLTGIVESSAASEEQKKSGNFKINFDTKLKFYLDIKTKKFLKKMFIKEKMLTQMIQNINDEIKARGKDKSFADQIGFDLIYGKGKNILNEYNSEISAIKDIVTELDKLELLIQKKGDLKLLKDVEDVQDQLMRALENHKIGNKNLSNQEIAQMIHEYSSEINHVLKIYDEIVDFQKRASHAGDVELVKQLERQKERVITILEESRVAGAITDDVVNDYIKEAAAVVDILKQVDQLKTIAGGDSSATWDIEQVQDNIVTAIDTKILNLFGYTQKEKFTGRTISDHYKNWKAEKITEYQVRYSRYQIFRDNLIRKATPEERNSMLENVISDALLSYADEEYELAEMQFQHIFSAYSLYYPNLDGVIFYQSEANYANNYYDSAQKGYLNIVQNCPNSKFKGQSYLRLMVINYTFNNDEDFFKYYDKLKEFDDLDKDDVNKANYLAAYRLTRYRRFDEANKILENFDNESKYFTVAKYLRGIVLANLDKYNSAKKIFENIVNKNNYPWTDLNISIIKNESLLKLGYMSYERGEYEKALSYFLQTSKGFKNYDNSLIGQAWTNLKKGQYDNVINKVDLLCNNYLMSNYTYEGMVLSAHCKQVHKKTQDALTELRYVANSKKILDKVKEYNEERGRILKQLDELGILENKILERQNRSLYPKVVKVRALIDDALTSLRYRGAVSSRVLENYTNERKIVVRQIDEFDKIVKFAEKQGDKKMLNDALKQRDRLVSVLRQYQLKQPVSNMSYFLDYPLAAKEGGIIYRRGIVDKLIQNLMVEKRAIQKNMAIITELAQIRDKNSRIDVTVDLEILEEDFQDMNNQLSQFQVWLANNKVENIETQTTRWADFSGFGVSDINFDLFREQNRKIVGWSKNVAHIEDVISKKKHDLEMRIMRFDDVLMNIQKDMELEKIRLEKLEKEKYFQEMYFENKKREIEDEQEDGLPDINSLMLQEDEKL